MFSLCEMLLKAWPFRFLKTTEQYFLLFLFIMLNKVVLMLISLDEFSNVLLYKVLFIMYTHESVRGTLQFQINSTNIIFL